MNLSNSTRWILSATLVMAAALGIGRFAYTPLLPAMVTHFDWTFATAGDIASANYLGYMIGALLAPRITASAQVRLWIAGSLMASVATTFLGSEATSVSHWLLLRLLSGVASAFCLVAMTTNLIYVLAAERVERLGNVHFAGVGVGILMCMGAVYAEGDIGAQWARLGAVSAFVMALAWFLIANQPFIPPNVSTADVSSPHGGWHLWLLIVGYGFFGFGYVVAATFVVAMAEQTAASGFDARTVWLVVGLALVPSVYVWQWLANRIGLLAALRAAYLIEAVGVMVAGVASAAGVLMAACVLLGGTFAAITALGISAARQAAPQRIAFAVSAMTVAFALGQLLGPAVAGRMADALGGFVWPSIVAGVLLMLAAALTTRPRAT